MSESVIWRGSSVLEEQATSPEWERGDTVKATTIHKGPHALCLSSMPSKGALGGGSYAGLRVASSKVGKEKGGIGTLTVTYEGVLATDTDVPADEADVELTQQEFPLARHPRYAGLYDYDLEAAEKYVEAKTDSEKAEFSWVLTVDVPSPEYGALLAEYIDKLQKGRTHWVVFVPVYTSTSHYLVEPTVDPGGFPEDPYGTLTAPLGFVWLRQGDKLSGGGDGYYKLTRTWLAAYEWDEDLYPPEPA